MKRKWIKWVSWILLTPILLFVVLMVLLYVPPVQNFLRKQATSYASEATGMQINVGRIDLRFPLNLLVRDVEVIQVPDTLLTLGSLNVHVQAMPLFKGKIEVDDITLQQVTVNSADLIEGMKIRGVLGRFFLESHGVDLTDETAVINHVELSDTHIGLVLNDTANGYGFGSHQLESRPSCTKFEKRFFQYATSCGYDAYGCPCERGKH